MGKSLIPIPKTLDEAEKSCDWRVINNFQTYYCSRDGQIISFNKKHKTTYVFKGCPDKDGYIKISLTRDGKLYNKRRSCLIAENWIGPRPDGYLVCHENGINTDDYVDNLSYKTVLDNSRDRYRHNTMLFGEDNPNSKLTEKDVAEIYTSNLSYKELVMKYSISRNVIDSIKGGVIWRHVTKDLIKGTSKIKTSRYKGVSRHHGGKWVGYLVINYIRYRKFGFITEDEAYQWTQEIITKYGKKINSNR